jgi:hypothetical protein
VDEFNNAAVSNETCATAQSSGGALVIAELFARNGPNGEADFSQSYVLLFNRTAEPISLAGYSIQFAPSGSPTWTVGALNNQVVAPRGYFLVGVGQNHPIELQLQPDFVVAGVITGTGKVALMSTAAPINSTCPTPGTVLDLVGYGATSDCFDGAPAPFSNLFTAVIRADQGCQDTDNNAADFIQDSPTGRNSASPTHSCPSAAVGRTLARGGAGR